MSLVTKLKGTGPSGFGASSTADEVTAGLDLHGKTYLITGCAGGLGKETMRALASRGARIVATARTAERARQATADLGLTDAVALACQLADATSVRECVAEVKRQGLSLDGIICNAGVMALRERQVVHGCELQLFTNHVGHFILVTGLLENLTDKGRVVVLSSAAHMRTYRGGIDFSDLSASRSYGPWKAYGQSKLANILFANELSRRFDGTGRTANSLHPGVIGDTDLWKHLPPIANTFMRRITPAFLKTQQQGAATSCYVATHPSLERVSGRYFADCNVAQPSAYARDATLAQQLWDRTEQLVASIP